MNIQNRIKKLETVLGTAQNNEFCQCFDKDILASINKVYGEPYNAADILPEGTLVTDVCERCSKPVEKRIREFYQHVNLCYGEV